MRKSEALALAFLLTLAAPAQSQELLLMGAGVKVAGGGGGYSGPGDVTAAAAYWSASWAYSAASRGNNAIQACNASDANCVDIPTDATTGLLAISTTNVGANPCNDSTNVCTIKTFYDQTGNGHTMTNTTISERATLLVTCTGLGTGVSCSTGTAAKYVDAINTTQAQAYTALWVANRNTSTGTDDVVLSADDFSFKGGYGFFAAANRVNCSSGSDQQVSGVNDGTWYQVACVMNGASGAIQIDATSTTKNMGTGGPSAAKLRWLYQGSDFMKGKVAMGAFYSSGLSSGDISSISSANHTIGGF